MILVLVVGGFSVFGTHTHWPYQAWLAIGCAVGLLVLAVASNRERPLVALERADAVALTGATSCSRRSSSTGRARVRPGQTERATSRMLGAAD